MPGITPNLWFDTEAEEAAEFYCSVFPNSKITAV
ncbi:MAG TPA: VOC family protein, partial [Acidimicrobiia bacterium]